MSTCPICKNSGETGSYGVLDCSAPNCTAAVERLALEAAASTASLTDYDARWMAYGLGKAAVFEQAAKDAKEADLDARNNIAEACGLGINSRRSFSWGFLLSYIKAACEEP